MSELGLLVLTSYFFWYPTPIDSGIDRADWFWLLGLFGLIFAARYFVHGRLWTRTLLDGWFVAFIALCFLSTMYAPYPSRGIMMAARPVLGMLWVVYLVEVTRTRRSIAPALLIMMLMGVWVGGMALFSTNWEVKSADLFFIIRVLPRIEIMDSSFNPNEIAGAMTWLIPLSFGVIVYAAQVKNRLLHGAAVLGFCLMLLALMLGQSRAAILGVIPAVFVLIMLAVPAGRWRFISLAGLIFVVLVQYMILVNVFPNIGPQIEDERGDVFGLSPRDERTTSQRFDMWRSALAIVQDYPLTGVGMARFRYQPVRDRYPIPNFDIPRSADQTNFQRRIVPHAHNEYVQIATDLGIPGFVVFVAWNGITAYMLLRCWWVGDKQQKTIALAVGTGLLAHTVYAMGDAIPLWDRFSFLYWMMMGLAAAHYHQVFSQHLDDIILLEDESEEIYVGYGT